MSVMNWKRQISIRFVLDNNNNNNGDDDDYDDE